MQFKGCCTTNCITGLQIPTLFRIVLLKNNCVFNEVFTLLTHTFRFELYYVFGFLLNSRVSRPLPKNTQINIGNVSLKFMVPLLRRKYTNLIFQTLSNQWRYLFYNILQGVKFSCLSFVTARKQSTVLNCITRKGLTCFLLLKVFMLYYLFI